MMSCYQILPVSVSTLTNRIFLAPLAQDLVHSNLSEGIFRADCSVFSTREVEESDKVSRGRDKQGYLVV